MATYDNTVKAARMNATRGEFLNGTLELMSASDAVLAVFTFSATAGTVTNGVWTLAFASTSSVGTAAASTGTVATKAQFKNSVGTARLTGLTVGTTGTNIIIDNTNIAQSQVVNIVGTPTITHAA